MKFERAAVVVGVAFALTLGCSSWSGVREDARNMRSELGACTDKDVCVIVKGRAGDCTGYLGCDFAVRSDHKDEAEGRATDLANQSRGFNTCAESFCAGGTTPYCDTDMHTCLIK